jgi:hypothetical protein
MGNGTRFGVTFGAVLSVATISTLAGAAPSDTSSRSHASAAEKSASPVAPGRRRGGSSSRDDGAASRRVEGIKDAAAIAKDERPARAETPASNDARPRAKEERAASSAKVSAKEKPGIAAEVEGGNHPPHPRRGPRSGVSPATVKSACIRDAVFFERGFGGDAESIVLTRCDGRPNTSAIEQLSILVRPMSAARPSPLASRIRRASHREWLPGVKRIHEGLVTRLQQVVDRFRAQRITLVSGYRPTSLGSFHQSARALDVHVEGVRNESLVEFCRTLPDTGCGYYPNSSFVHIDVRPAGTGHVYWIDASGPGEPARYVSSWPPKDSASVTSGIAPPDPAAPLDEQTHPGAGARPPLGGNDAKIDARTTAPWWGGDGLDTPFSP